MQVNTEDFWGELGTATVRTPVSLMREQAALLGKKTSNLVEAHVKTDSEGGRLVHRFHLIVPALDGYTYRLFKVSHGMEIYPVMVGGYDPRNPLDSKQLANEQEFTDFLREILSAESTKRIILTLLAQVQQ